MSPLMSQHEIGSLMLQLNYDVATLELDVSTLFFDVTTLIFSILFTSANVVRLDPDVATLI